MMLILMCVSISDFRPWVETGLPGPAFAAEEESDLLLSPGFDVDDPPDTTIALAPHLTFGAEIEIESEVVLNPDLNRETGDDRLVMEPQLDTAVSYDPTEFLRAFLETELTWELVHDRAGDSTGEITLEINQLYISLREILPGTSLQIGRQEFKDEREWLFDEDLDAVRIFQRVSRFGFELSVSRERLVDKDLLHDEENLPINHYFLLCRYALTPEAEAGLYALLRNDRTTERDRPLFLGFHALGELGEELAYWAEIAHVRGKTRDREIRGFGFDIGATRKFDVPFAPYLTLGYAFGSGDDDPADSTDKTFRQTGFQDNTAKFGGVVKIPYYGEVFDPELSNLSIFTSGIGMRPLKTMSIDVIYHHYRQHRSSDRIRDSQLQRDPGGESKEIGQEVDMVFGYKTQKPDIGIEFGIGNFMPGAAFPSGADSMWGFRFELQYTF